MNGTLGTFILVDDDHEDAYLMQRALDFGRVSAQLIHLPDGTSFLSYIRNNRLPEHCLVLLDLNMPVRDGFSVLEILREAKALPTLPLIVYTTTSDRLQVERAYQAGAKAFITKPTSLKEAAGLFESLASTWFRYGSIPGEIGPFSGIAI